MRDIKPTVLHLPPPPHSPPPKMYPHAKLSSSSSLGYFSRGFHLQIFIYSLCPTSSPYTHPIVHPKHNFTRKVYMNNRVPRNIIRYLVQPSKVHNFPSLSDTWSYLTFFPQSGGQFFIPMKDRLLKAFLCIYREIMRCL